MRQLSFTKACVEYFGKLPGQSLQDFSAELKRLTPADRHDLARYFRAVDIEVQAEGQH